jgi:hypothetical protein
MIKLKLKDVRCVGLELHVLAGSEKCVETKSVH